MPILIGGSFLGGGPQRSPLVGQLVVVDKGPTAPHHPRIWCQTPRHPTPFFVIRSSMLLRTRTRKTKLLNVKQPWSCRKKASYMEDATMHDRDVSLDTLRAKVSRHTCRLRPDLGNLRQRMKEPSYEPEAIDIVSWADLEEQGWPVPAIVHDAA